MPNVGGSFVVAAAGTGFVTVGPFPAGRILTGLHLSGSSDNAADRSFEVDVRLFNQAPDVNGQGFADGEPIFQVFNGTPSILVPVESHTFIPIDAEFDRASWVQVSCVAGAGTLSGFVCAECGRLPAGNQDQRPKQLTV